jgi:hypothetical protein
MIDHLEQDPILVVDNLKLAYGDYLGLRKCFFYRKKRRMPHYYGG